MKKKLETRQSLPYLFSMIKNNANWTAEMYREMMQHEHDAARALARRVGAYQGVIEAIRLGLVAGVTVADPKVFDALVARAETTAENLANR